MPGTLVGVLIRTRAHSPRSATVQEAPRGQGLVEFAIVLPLLALLLVMAADFGRIFFGWVALQNAARIGADYASQEAERWPDDRDVYRGYVLSDLNAINCQPPAALDADGDGVWDPADVPDPTFLDVDGNGDVDDDGDHAWVQLTCLFDLLTPLAETVLGGPVTLGADAYFAINGPLLPAVGAPAPPPPGPCPGPTADFDMLETSEDPTSDVNDGQGNHPLTIAFTDTSTEDVDCPITSWEWDFQSDGIVDSAVADPTFTFNYPGPGPAFKNFLVELTVSNGTDTSMHTETVRVRRP